MVAPSTTEAKSASDAFTTQRSGVWHFPQRGMPDAVAGTRFLVWQFVHVTICGSEFSTFELMQLPLSPTVYSQVQQ